MTTQFENWQQIRSSLETALSQLNGKDAEVSDIGFFEPPSAEQVDDLERVMEIKLPEEFRQLLGITGGFRFDWVIESSPFDYLVYGGNSEVEFLRGSGDLALAQVYQEFQQMYSDYSVEDEEQVSIIQNCFPLYLTDLNGNALVARLDTNPVEIHLLESELAWAVSDSRSLVGRGLLDFLTHWSLLAGPSTENLHDIVEACGGHGLDAGSSAGCAVREWLSSDD